MYSQHESPDLFDIRCFVALAATKSFSAASKLLGRDATSLSRRMQALEKRLGVSLADRSTRSFVLTEAGEAYLSRVTPLVSELDAAACDAAAYVTGGPRGRLRVALPGSFARIWLEPILVSFMQAHAGIVLDAHYSNTFADLIGNGFDAAIRLGELTDSRLVARKVASRRRLVCASPAYLERCGAVMRPEDVSTHACLCFTGRRDPLRWVFRNDDETLLTVTANCSVASDDACLLVAAARAGLGLFYTTDWHVGPYIRSGALVEVLQDWEVPDTGAIYVLTPAASYMPNKTRAFSDWIATHLANPPWER